MFHISNNVTLQASLFSIFPIYNAVWNNFGGKFFQQQEDIYFTKETHQNDGCYTY